MLVLIGVLKETEKKVVGYRLANIENGQVNLITVPASALNKIAGEKIVNAEVVNKTGKIELKGTNGTLDRYPVINAATGQLVGKCPIIILTRLNDGFRCINGNGAIALFTNRDALTYSKMSGISNGKITKIKGTEIISSIVGNYPFEDVTIIKPEEVKKAPKYSEEFYKRVAERYGQPKTDLMKYMIEDRKYSMKMMLEFLASSDIGCILAGLLEFNADIEKGKTDAGMVKVLSRNVEKAGLDILESLFKSGIAMAEFWDTERTVRYDTSKEDSKYGITLTAIENKIYNFKLAGSELSKKIKVDVNPEKKAAAEKKGYTVIGFNPLKNTITVEDNKNEIHRTHNN